MFCKFLCLNSSENFSKVIGPCIACLISKSFILARGSNKCVLVQRPLRSRLNGNHVITLPTKNAKCALYWYLSNQHARVRTNVVKCATCKVQLCIACFAVFHSAISESDMQKQVSQNMKESWKPFPRHAEFQLPSTYIPPIVDDTMIKYAPEKAEMKRLSKSALFKPNSPWNVRLNVNQNAHMPMLARSRHHKCSLHNVAMHKRMTRQHLIYCATCHIHLCFSCYIMFHSIPDPDMLCQTVIGFENIC